MDQTDVGFEVKICGVSMLYAGEAMDVGLHEVCRSMRIDKILILWVCLPAVEPHSVCTC